MSVMQTDFRSKHEAKKAAAKLRKKHDVVTIGELHRIANEGPGKSNIHVIYKVYYYD